jgi:hypothetical protein
MDASKSRNAVKIRDESSSRENSIIMDGISSRTARIDSREDSSYSISRDIKGTIWMPTTHVFRENLPKSIQNGEKFVKKDTKNNKNFPFYVR